MKINEIRNLVSQMCIDGIISCIKDRTIKGNSSYPFSQMNRDIDFEIMKFYWALTEGIEQLAITIIKNPRRLTSSISFEEVISQGEISGSINASATVMLQSRTLNPTLFVINEPYTTFNSEPNHLVAWLLHEALNILFSVRKIYGDLEEYSWYNNKINLLENSLRNNILKEILSSPSGKQKPSKSTLRAASKSRVVLYQNAINLYNMLERIEYGDKDTIIDCLNDSLVANLEYWQRLELGVGLSAASALSHTINSPVKINFPFIHGRPIATVGEYKIYWQYTIQQRPDNELDLNEKLIKEIANIIGIKLSNSRADIAITYCDKIVNIFECKYSESEEPPTQAIIDAISQLVRYARDLNFSSISNTKQFLSKCFIVVSDCNKYNPINSMFKQSISSTNTYLSDIKNISNNSLEIWAKELNDFCCSNIS